MDKPSFSADACLEQVIRNYANMVYRLAFARTGSRYDADEIFQEVFLRYIKKQPVFKSEEHRKAWLIKVTVNCCKKLWDSPWKKRVQPLDSELPFEAKEEIGLYRELQCLPPKYREVIHLFYYEDLPLEEISRILKRKNTTIRVQLMRARAMLKTIIEEDNNVQGGL